jgi:hypothetical protein
LLKLRTCGTFFWLELDLVKMEGGSFVGDEADIDKIILQVD